MTEYVYKLKNGKVVSAYADEKGNISITKETLEIMANSWNDGYQKGYSDGHCKGRAEAIDEFARAYEHVELIGCEDCEREDDDIPCWECIAEQLKEQK